MTILSRRLVLNSRIEDVVEEKVNEISEYDEFALMDKIEATILYENSIQNRSQR